MRCTSPRKVGFKSDGKTIAWSPKQSDRQYANFQLPCGKCIACRLEKGRQWAVRATHEAQMHEQNSFITLTYSDEHLKSPWLIYEDFQLFMKKLRKTRANEISFMVAGEYGDNTKRPHWHALLFGYDPRDKKYLRQNDRGDKIYSSQELDKLWDKNDPKKKPNEIGELTFQSASYVARYAAKKLVHGLDNTHNYDPIFETSKKYAIGKKWLETYWPDLFNHGRCVLPDGNSCGIPRYYEKWFKVTHPEPWKEYVTKTKSEIAANAAEKQDREDQKFNDTILALTHLDPKPLTPNQVRAYIQNEKFKILQNRKGKGAN